MIETKKARVLAVTSGKGGVGKSNISTNLAIALARAGHRVCVFDADTGLANVNVLLDLRPDLTLEHLLHGDADIDDIVINAPGGIDIVPAASGIATLTKLDMAEQARLLDALHILESRYDFLVVDTAAGIGSTVTLFLHSVQHCLLIVTPEPTSLTDAFALLKVLHRQRCDTTVHVLTNMVDSYRTSIDVYKRLANASERYLGRRPEYIGYIPDDDCLRKSVQQQKPVMTGWPGAPSSQSFVALGRSLGELLEKKHRPGRFTRFWEALLARKHERPLLSDKKAPPASTSAHASARQKPQKENVAGSARFSKPAVMRLQQGMLRLIRSRTLPRAAMIGLLGSLLRAVRQQYPDISDDELDVLHRQQEKKRDGAPDRT